MGHMTCIPGPDKRDRGTEISQRHIEAYQGARKALMTALDTMDAYMDEASVIHKEEVDKWKRKCQEAETECKWAKAERSEWHRQYTEHLKHCQSPWWQRLFTKGGGK